MAESAQPQIRERVWIEMFDAVTKEKIREVLVENGQVLADTTVTTGPTVPPVPAQVHE